MTHLLLLGIPDLLISARVNRVARACGIPSIAVLTKHDLLSKAHGEEADLCILDLSAEQFSPVEAIADLRGDEHTRHITIIGVVPAFDAALATEMQRTGCTMVVSRDQLLQNLETIITGTFTPGTKS